MHYLLLQVRDPGDPMASHEIACFAEMIGCPTEDVITHDLLSGRPTSAELDDAGVVLLGGSGDYSVAEGGPWLADALEAMRELVEMSKPTFASCWGFQALARALGGEVVTDLERAEVGTYELTLTDAGHADPVFGPLSNDGGPFAAQLGHSDIVHTLPPEAVLLASSERTTNQAFKLEGKPIYCTQFHPELSRARLLDRLQRYPKYVERIAGISYEEFVATRCRESLDTPGLLTRFIETVTAAG